MRDMLFETANDAARIAAIVHASGGTVDTSTYSDVETALDKVNAPARDATGKWLPLPERIAAMAEDSIKQCEASLEQTRDAEAEIEHLRLIIAWRRPRLRMGEYRTTLDGWISGRTEKRA